MRKVLRTAAMVVTALSIIGLTGSSAFATTADPTATGTVDPSATLADPNATNTGSNGNGGGDADNEACNTTVVIINNGDDPTQGDTTGTTTGDCPATTTPAEPETPGMGAGTPETPAAPTTPAAPAAPVAMTLPDTGASSFGNLASTILTMIAAASGLFVAGFRTLRGTN